MEHWRAIGIFKKEKKTFAVLLMWYERDRIHMDIADI